MFSLRRVLAPCVIGGIAAVIALALHGTRWIERLEFLTWDVRQRWLATPVPSDLPIKLILIDQQSLDWAAEQAGTPWPWPREFYGSILKFCEAGGAKGIAFDLFFSEPSMFGQDDDNRFAAALREARVTVLAVPPGPRRSTPDAWPRGIPPSRFIVNGLHEWQAAHPEVNRALDSLVMSLPEIAGSVSTLAHVKAEQDADSIIRRVAPIVTFDGQVLPVLGLALHEAVREAGEARKAPQDGLRIEGDSLLVGPHQVPLDAEGRAILRYRAAAESNGGKRTYEAYSAAGIINAQLAIEAGEAPALSPEAMRKCYVIIGTSAAGTYDLKPTPTNKAAPGVEVHAAFLDNLLNDAFMREPREAWTWLFTLVLAVIGALVTRFARNGAHAAMGFVITLPVPWAAGMLSFQQGTWWPIAGPQLALVLALVGGLIVNYATEGRQRRFIKRSFQHYLSPAVIEQIVRDPSRLRLGGERREMSFLFSDIAGFSSLAEKLDAHTLAALLNEYLTDMTTIILEEGGTLDKYIGDAIVAFWNAPLDQPDHAVRAARAARRCQQALAERREAYRSRHGVDVHARIGVNTGEVSVGNFGSQSRFDYTVIGHAVNLAARLEGANKFFGTHTMIAHETWRHANGALRGREIGLLRVAGIDEPVRVHELLPDDSKIDGRSLADHQQALALCQSGKLSEALAAFERLADDPLALLYVEKLRAVLGEHAMWDGVWVLTGK